MEQRFVVLDSWRGIAACMVAFFHLNAYSHVFNLPLLRNAWLFVDFFFVLSGFIIAATYQQRLLEGFGVRRFILLRLGRLYPLHFTMLALFVAFELLKFLVKSMVPIAASPNAMAPFTSPAETPDATVANLLLIHSLHLYDCLTWNWPSWSISTEFYTYIVFAACLIGLRTHAWLTLPVALIAGPVLIVMLSKLNMNTNYDWGIIRCVYGFAAGVVVWELYKKSGKLKKWLASGTAGNAIELFALATVLIFVSVAHDATSLSIAAPYIFALVVFIFALESGSTSAILKFKPLVFLGTLSYSIYMTHVFVEQRLFDVASAVNKLLHVNVFTHRVVGGEDVSFLGARLWYGDIAYVVYITLVITMSYLTYRWIEKPGREWVRIRVRRPASAALREYQLS